MLASYLLRRTLQLGFVPLLVLSGQIANAPLSSRLPPDVPSRRILAGWERVQGSVQTDAASITYELYVNPARGALYEITHYRIVRGGGDARGLGEERSTEKVVWNEHPGRQILRVWERSDGRWEPIDPDTDSYRQEMRVVMQLYQLHHVTEMIGVED
jgi:hypothetical protein